MAITNLQINTLVFYRLISPRICANCTYKDECEVGQLNDRGELPAEIDVEQQREVLKPSNTSTPKLKCLNNTN